MTDPIEEFLRRAAAEPAALTIRDLLAKWGYRARTYDSVARIQRDLSAWGLTCEPDLGQGDGDTTVQVGPTGAAAPPDGDAADEPDEPLQLPPVALLVKHIPSASQGVKGVSPDDTLAHARSLMSKWSYSQVPVMSSDRDLRGVVSWRSIARTHATHSGAITLDDATTRPAPEVRAGEDLLRQIDLIYREDFAFVRDDDNDRICGIVTAADLTLRFHDLTAPYFHLGEIERRLRRCIDRAFSKDELRAGAGSSKLNCADDMVFGQYVRLLDDESRWRQIGWERYDRGMFIDCLEETRQVRNRVMHFGEALRPEDQSKLDNCLNFMRMLDPL